MAKFKILRGTQNRMVQFFVPDLSTTNGAGLVGLLYNALGLTAYYHRDGDATSTAIALATATLGTWTSGGLIAVDAVNMPGLVELGLPNAVLASGASARVYLMGAINMPPILLEIELDAVNYQSSTLGIAQLLNIPPLLTGTVNDVAPTASSFKGSAGLSAVDSFYGSALGTMSFLLFTTGANTGLAQPCNSYVGATKLFGFLNAFPSAPANGDAFVILGARV